MWFQACWANILFKKSHLSVLILLWRPPRGLVVIVHGFDSLSYDIFCVPVGLERGPLSLVSINEKLLERKVAAPV
jgi:hypothetical protein